jgi:hypothetical protein
LGLVAVIVLVGGLFHHRQTSDERLAVSSFFNKENNNSNQEEEKEPRRKTILHPLLSHMTEEDRPSTTMKSIICLFSLGSNELISLLSKGKKQFALIFFPMTLRDRKICIKMLFIQHTLVTGCRLAKRPAIPARYPVPWKTWYARFLLSLADSTSGDDDDDDERCGPDNRS